MLVQIVLAALVVAAEPEPTTATAPKAAGRITAAVGRVTIVREGKSLPASARSPLYPGDRVETGENAGAGAFLFAGQSVYLAGSTSLALPAEADRDALRIDRGEARVISGGARKLTVAAGAAVARLDRGILRVAAAGDQGSRFWAEDGPAEVIPGNQAPVALPSGQQINVPNAGPVPPPVNADAAAAGAWKVNVDPLQLSGAADASRRLRSARTDQADDESSTIPGMGGETDGSKSPDFSANQPVVEAQPNTPAAETFQPVIEAQPNTASSAFTSSLAFASFGGSSFGSTSGGLNADAQQQSLKPGLAGNINLITAQTRYTLNTIQLKTQDVGNGPGLFPTARTYYSVGLGAAPTGPVLTNFLTGATGTPQTLTIPHFNAYVLQFNQYGIPDPASTTPNNLATTSGISGLLGAKPASPQITGATPLLDNQAAFNNKATFALGEFALQTSSTGKPVFDLRRSDQDRQIIKSPTGNDNLDKVTLNPQVGQFNKVKDYAFFPQAAYVLQPQTNSFGPKPTYAHLSLLQKAAVTTLLADTLYSYAKRTGQTRFTLGGQIVDITGYHLPSSTTATATARTAAARPPLSAFGANPTTMRGIAGAGGHAAHTVVRQAHH